VPVGRQAVGESGKRLSQACRWPIVVAAAAGLAVGALLRWALTGLAGPFGVVREVPIPVADQQVWSGRRQGGLVQVGWAHSPAGAIAAATSYTVVLSSELLFDAARRDATVDAIAAPQAHERLRRNLEDQAKLIAASLLGIQDADKALARVVASKVVFQTIPVRYHLDAYDGTHARVTIWQTGVAGYQDSSLPPQEAWGSTKVQLQWIDNDWKETDATVTDGPVPAADSDPPTPAPDLIREVQQFTEYHAAPG
jgi:hypothetical protein